MIIQELGLIGEVTLVRFVGETMWVTFRDGQSTLIAVQKKSIRIRGIDFHINLKTENWLAQVEREIALCTTNTVQLCSSSPGKKLIFILFFHIGITYIILTIVSFCSQLETTIVWVYQKHHQAVQNHRLVGQGHQYDHHYLQHQNMHQKPVLLA